MPWPLSQDYNEALQNPQTSFSDPELRQGQVAVNALGIPQPCSGNFADVYAVAGAASNTKWAVKCFTREVHGLRERYSEISSYLQQVRLPFTVDFQYQEQGIRIAGRWYPILKMHWVEGFTLNLFVRDMLDKPAMLDALGQIWLRMARRLREAKIGHCDLQHGNILLVPGSTPSSLAVKLIDYDGMWVPGLANVPSGEFGHPAYQHPQRLREGAYKPEVDRFSLLVIYCALRALRIGGRQLWERYDTGDNLLFGQQDFEAPARSPLLAELLRMNHTEVRELAAKIVDAARMPLDQLPHLADLIAEEKPAALAARGKAKAASRAAAPARPEPNAFEDIDAGSAGGRLRRKARRSGSLLAWIAAGSVAACAVVASALSLGLHRDGASEKAATQAPLVQAKNRAPKPVPRDQKSAEPDEAQPSAKADKPDAIKEDSRPSDPPPIPDEPPSAPKKGRPSLPAQASIADLRRALKNNDNTLREIAAARLASLGPSAEPALEDLAEALSDEKNTVPVRRNAALAIAHIGPAAKKVVPALVKALNRTQPLEVRHYAAEALAQVKYPANEDALAAIVDAIENDPDPQVKHKCIWALSGTFPMAKFRECGADKALTQLLDERRERFRLPRYEAARYLAYFLREDAPDKTTDALLEMLNQKWLKEYDRTDADVADAGKSTMSGRTEVQTKTRGDGRFYAAEALGLLGKKASDRKDVRDALQAAAKDADPKLRQTAIAALKSLDDKRAAASPDAAQTPERPPPAAKLPVPDEDAQKKAAEDIRDIYKADYAGLRQADERVALAVKLLKRGTNKGEQAERRFAYLSEARDLAARGGDVAVSLTAIDELAKTFSIEPLAMKVAALELAAKALRSSDAAKKLFGQTLTALDEAESSDDYEHAARLLKIAQSAVLKSGDSFLRSVVAQRENRLKNLRAEYAKIADAVKTLADKPDDAEANLTVGKFQCFAKEDWSKGLPMLARSQDAALAELARKEKEEPAGAEEQAALGQAWWSLAEKQRSASIKKAAQQRARHWFRIALPYLSGAEADRVASLLEVKMGRLKLRPGLVAEMFGDEKFQKRIKARLDYKVDYDWAEGSPGDKMPADHFSIRWQGWLVPPRAGKYKLTITHDDGARLKIDGQTVIDGWGGPGSDSKEVVLTGQPHLLQLEFWESIVTAGIHLQWSLEGGFKEQMVPLDALYHEVKQERLLAP